jgi:hypothetical protein
MLRAVAVVVGLVSLFPLTASAEKSKFGGGIDFSKIESPAPGRLPQIVPRLPKFLPALPEGALAGHTIFLNRCMPDGCQMKPGDDDMSADPTPSGVPAGNVTLAPASDLTEEEWTAIVQCVREVYSPFDVKVTDVRPTNVAQYSGIMVAGNNDAKAGAALGLPPGVGGLGGGTGCSPDPKGVAFAFADNNNVNIFAREALGNTSSEARVKGMCWIIAQETGHNFSLDHEYEYIDDKASACNDPMTYEADCGGQKFFRNRFAACGVSGGADGSAPGPRACFCGPSQNSHLKLLNLFGAGTSLIPPPTAEITSPAASSTAANTLGMTVVANAGSARGVGRVELWINGFKWAEVKGAPFGRTGQANPSSYQLVVPADLPDSIADIQIKAFDDLELLGESAVVTVVKGKAGGCTAAEECAEGQKCEAGKCFWDPPTGQVGDACSFPQACVGGLCSDSVFQGDGICTQSCVIGLADACPPGLECIDAGNNNAICFTPLDEGGCCSTGGGSPWGAFALGGIVLGLFAIRRKR